MEEQDFGWCFEKVDRIRKEIEKVIVGQKALVSRLLIGFLTEGHLLLEGVPGIAKTLAVNTFARTLKLDFKRIQFTPDLLPADLIGTSVYNPKESSFFVHKGPVFTNVVLADEINRAPPKVQSALLEVMQERQVTIVGQTFKVSLPFIVLATQNPIEQEGTYPLPEAEVDRFMMKIKIGYPKKDEEIQIVMQQLEKRDITVQPVVEEEEIERMKSITKSVFLDEKVLRYIVDIVAATRNPKEYSVPVEGFIDYGASPRGSICLAQAAKAHALLEGRSYVTPYDVKSLAADVLRHRLILSYEALAANHTPDSIVDAILDKIVVP